MMSVYTGFEFKRRLPEYGPNTNGPLGNTKKPVRTDDFQSPLPISSKKKKIPAARMVGSEGLITGGRRRSSLPSPASPVENVDILSEILIRLSPAPA